MKTPTYKFFNVFKLCSKCQAKPDKYQIGINDLTYFRNVGVSGVCCSCLENTGQYIKTIRIPVVDGMNDFRFQIIIYEFPKEIYKYWIKTGGV